MNTFSLYCNAIRDSLWILVVIYLEWQHRFEETGLMSQLFKWIYNRYSSKIWVVYFRLTFLVSYVYFWFFLFDCLFSLPCIWGSTITVHQIENIFKFKMLKNILKHCTENKSIEAAARRWSSKYTLLNISQI